VAALRGLDRQLRDFRSESELDDRFAARIMLRHGVPTDVVTALRAVSASFRAWGCTVEVDRPLAAGEELQLRDRTLRVLHRPGHSPSDTVFHDERRSLLIAGDHLLAHISSNPLIARPLGGGSPDDRPRPLLDYIASMQATRAMPIGLTLPGHGDPVGDHAGLIDERMRMTERRASKILKLLQDAGEPLSAHQLAVQMWGNVAVSQAFLTLSEVLGHLDVLSTRAAVVEEYDGERSRFRVA
jgi:glyoxylase-like metal-dependent hydrolase (beta-lactamase superfamily II)